MSVPEAVAKTFEVITRAEYAAACGPQRWGSSFEGTYEEYLAAHYSDEDSWSGEVEPFDPATDFDSEQMWKEHHWGSSEAKTYENYTAKVEAAYGGEGEGDQYWMVVSISDGETTRYFRKDGWYASYDGGYLDGDTYEVTPQEKVITVYEKAN
jgi:hypothetical protein